MPRFHFDSASRSDIGLKRELNEDNCFSASESSGQGEGIVGVLAVADGMGGHDAGDVASKITCEFLQHLFTRKGYIAFSRDLGIPSDDYRSLVAEALRSVHEKIVERARSFNLYKTMGCTCVVGLVVYNQRTDASTLVLGWVGDSRCYVVRGKEILLATEDDSYVWDLYKQGRISYSEMRLHPKRNVVTQALGTNTTVTPRTNFVTLKPNDIILVSTDGLHGSITDQEIKTLLQSSPDASTATRRLVESANNAGGRDNISVAVSYCLKEPRHASVPAVKKTSVLKKAVMVCLLFGSIAMISRLNVQSASSATSKAVPTYRVKINPLAERVAVGETVPINFVVEPYDVIKQDRRQYSIAAAIDMQTPDTLNFGAIPEVRTNQFALPVKFASAALHTVRFSLLGAGGNSALSTDAIVVMANETPGMPRKTETIPSPREERRRPAPQLFTLIKGLDGKIQLRLTREFNIGRGVDVAVSSEGEEDIVTLTRVNINVPKATMVNYRSGGRVSVKIIGSNRTLVSTLR
ncbi:MAG TPA: protein phosphatase 2C domain-containing protein [Bacteroidota bacterium]